MKKTLMTAMLMLFVLVVSAIGATYPIEYEDNTCRWVRHGWMWVHECDDVSRETSVDVPETDLTPVETRLYTLENDGGFGYSRFIKAMRGEVLDWLKSIFVTREDFREEFNEYKLEQEELNKMQNTRIFACEKALGMTRGYD